jgi:hypothetical protein
MVPPVPISSPVTSQTVTQTKATDKMSGRRAYLVAFGALVILTGAWVAWTQWKLGRSSDGFGSSPLVGWISCIVLLAAFAMLIGHVMTKRLDGLFIDSRNRISLSRVQVSLWTGLILSALLTAGLWSVAKGLPNAFDIQIPKEIWALFGVSITSGVGAALIKFQMDDNEKATKEDATKASWGDLVRGDRKANEARVDLSKVQMLYFTVVVVLGYAVALGHLFVNNANFPGFPPLNETIVYLLVISHGGYLTYKQLSPSGSTQDKQGVGGANDGNAGGNP